MAIAAPPRQGAVPPVRPTGGLAGGLGLLFVLLAFAIIAAVVFINNGDPERRRIELVAQQYADAWAGGNLSKLEYDRLSNPDVDNGDPGKIDDNVHWITHDLDGQGKLNPSSISVDREATTFQKGTALATTRLWVTWTLQRAGLSQAGHVWTYPVTLQEHQDGGRWRVVWTPQTVHPSIRHGMVFRVKRTLAPRAGLIGAGDTPLPPAANRNLAHAVLGSIVTKATEEQAELNDLRATPGDTVGVAGLQDLFDTRLAGGAQIEVDAGVVQGYTGLAPQTQPLFVGAPETPTPIKVSLDATTQGWAEAALKAAPGTATLVVSRPSTGQVLAVANSDLNLDYGLSSQQPPGPVFGLTDYLAMLRQGYTSTSRVDCRQPWTFPGKGQVFRNSQGPTLDQVTLGAAIEGGCTTALAKLYGTIPTAALQTAAWDLGIATPLQKGTGDTPSWVTVSDQLGTPAYLGRINSDSDADDAGSVDPLHNAENLVGEGKVLVSPLSMTRASATIATGRRKALRLITDPAPQQPDVEKALSPTETQALQDIMARGVTEAGGSAHTLAGLAGSTVYALAGTAGYGTGASATRQAWVTGFRGDYAFTVLLPNATSTTGAQSALEVARRFLVNIA